MACPDDVFEGTDNWGQQIQCLREEIAGLSRDIKNASQAASTFSSKLGDSFNVMKNLGKTLNSLKSDMVDFTKSSERQYDLAEQIAESYKRASLSIGLSVGRSRDFATSFKGAVAEIAKFGGSIDDAQGIYEEFAETSGRVRILGKDEVENIFKLGKATNLVGSEATNLFETMELMGVSNLEASERMTKLVMESQKVGLNSSKVMKALSNSMNQMQGYSFVGGVRGMTEMAKQAVKMRIDVADVLQMADKFYQPEAAIEAAANLQMLGGDIAQAFGDPFETMYLARNKPAELGKRLQDMTENMLQFNKETKEYELPPEARMQLKAAGEQLGISVDKMVELARQSTKIKDIKDKLSMTGMFDEDEMEGIASMARMEGGKFVVDIRDDEGKKITKSIDDLTSGEVEMLMKAPTDEQDYMSTMVTNSMTTNELLTSINDSFQKAFVGEFDMYQVYEDSSKQTLEATRDAAMKSVGVTIDALKDSMVGQGLDFGKDALMSIDTKMSELIDSMDNFISGPDDTRMLNIDSNGIVTIKSSDTNINMSTSTPGSQNTNVNLSDPNQNNNNNDTSQNTTNYNGQLDVNLNFGGQLADAFNTPELKNMIGTEVNKILSNGLEVVTDGTNINVVLTV